MKKYLISILILIVLILAACAGAETPAESPDVVLTSAVGSMVASFFGTQTAMYTPPQSAVTVTVTNTFLSTPTFLISTPTFATFTPGYYSATPTKGTATPTGTLTTSTPDPASLASGCNNLAFIRDVNIPAGTVLEKNQVFTKTWKVKNTGTCIWNSLYAIISSGGDKLGGETTRISPVLVGNWSEVSVELQAPNTAGTYTGYWRVSNGQRVPFGASLAVTIVVKDAVPTAVPPTSTTVPSATPVTPAYPSP